MAFFARYSLSAFWPFSEVAFCGAILRFHLFSGILTVFCRVCGAPSFSPVLGLSRFFFAVSSGRFPRAMSLRRAMRSVPVGAPR